MDPDRPTPAGGQVPLLAMGCRWSLDLDSLPAEEVEPMRERWSRCADLAVSPDALVLDERVETIRVRRSPTTPVDPTGADAATGDEVTLYLGDPADLAYDLSRAVTRRGIHRLRGTGPLLLHAAALSDGGRATVLVAQSGGGKSTAARRLSQAFGYVTDESVVLTEDLALAPYPKPPSLIVDPDRPASKEEPAPDAIGMGATPADVELGALLGLRRDAEVTTPEIVEVDLADHLLEVIPETSSLWLVPGGGLDRLARAVTHGGPPAELRYAEIDECVDLLREHLAQARPAEPWWVHLPPPDGRAWLEQTPPPWDPEAAATAEITADTPFVRAPWSDALDDDGALVILQGSRVFCLEATLRAVWLVCDVPLPVRDIVELVVALQGPHPEADDLVRESLRALHVQGILHRTDTVHAPHPAEIR